MRKFCLLAALSFAIVLTRADAQVGIGTVTPLQKLDVNGAIKIGTTATTSKGSIKYTQADSSFEVYDNTRWKSMINNFDVVGIGLGGRPQDFSSMTRDAYVNLPDLTYTIKKSGYYLVLLTATGRGYQEKNDLYNPTDNRSDLNGEIRLSRENSPGSWYLTKTFFYIVDDANGDVTQDITFHYHSDDGEKSLIRYFDEGDVIQTYVRVAQDVGNNAPAQQKPWEVSAQVKYILLF